MFAGVGTARGAAFAAAASAAARDAPSADLWTWLRVPMNTAVGADIPAMPDATAAIAVDPVDGAAIAPSMSASERVQNLSCSNCDLIQFLGTKAGQTPSAHVCPSDRPEL